jgi:hypothetical protein
MSNIPNQEPASLRVGDTWRWTRSLADYPAPTWVLKYRFKNAAGGFEIVATASGTDQSVTVAAVTTATYTAGNYTWQAWVEGGSSEKYTVDDGSMVLEADYRAAAANVALDDRSHARKMLDQIEAWMETHADGVSQYEIAGRRVWLDKAGLIKQHNHYTAMVQNEENAAKLARGEGIGKKIQLRLG